MKKITVKEITLIGIMSALICVVAPFSLPIGPIPITLANFVIYFAVVLLGKKLSTISCIVYLLLGGFGVPVFSNFGSGVGYILGPTGGYLVGFVFMALLSGIIVDKFRGKVSMYILGLALGTIIDYAFGTFWFVYQQKTTVTAALVACVYPFVVFDTIKLVAAAFLGEAVRHRLIKSNIISSKL